MEGITQDGLFNFIVKWGIRRERGGLVDFEKPWFTFVVDHYVETQDLKAHRAVYVFRLARTVKMT